MTPQIISFSYRLFLPFHCVNIAAENHELMGCMLTTRPLCFAVICFRTTERNGQGGLVAERNLFGYHLSRFFKQRHKKLVLIVPEFDLNIFLGIRCWYFDLYLFPQAIILCFIVQQLCFIFYLKSSIYQNCCVNSYVLNKCLHQYRLDVLETSLDAYYYLIYYLTHSLYVWQTWRILNTVTIRNKTIKLIKMVYYPNDFLLKYIFLLHLSVC